MWCCHVSPFLSPGCEPPSHPCPRCFVCSIPTYSTPVGLLNMHEALDVWRRPHLPSRVPTWPSHPQVSPISPTHARCWWWSSCQAAACHSGWTYTKMCAYCAPSGQLRTEEWKPCCRQMMTEVFRSFFLSEKVINPQERRLMFELHEQGSLKPRSFGERHNLIGWARCRWVALKTEFIGVQVA